MRAVIIAHGTMSDFALMRTFISPHDIVIAADGGALYAENMGILPHILIGDMDSLGEEKFKYFAQKNVEIIKYPKEKDETDTHLALLHAIKLGVQEIVVLAATGSRIDHTFGNLLLAFHPNFKDINIIFKDEQQDISLLSNNSEIEGQNGETFSLILLENITGLSIKGAKYPLNNVQAVFGASLTLSNEFLQEKVRISWDEGEKILLVRQRGTV